MSVYGTNTALLGVDSSWHNDTTAFVVRVRQTKDQSKLLVDVMELATGPVSRPGTDLKFARSSAEKFGAVCADATIINVGLRKDRKVTNADGSQSLVKVVYSTFAFASVQ